MKEIERIEYEDGTSGNFYSANIGKDKVKEILEHPARGEGDKWFYTVIYEDGREMIVFYPHRVYKREVNVS